MSKRDEKTVRDRLRSASHMTTNDWEILGEDRIGRFPSKIGEKRRIDVDINTWRGISIGAKHFYVEVKEENNSWWCEAENAWVEIYSDSEKGGYSLKADVYSEKEAVEVALFFIQLIAGKKRQHHVVAWSGPGRPRWAT